MLRSKKEYPKFNDYVKTMGFIDTRLDVTFSGRLNFIDLNHLCYAGTKLYCCTSTLNGEEFYFVVPVYLDYVVMPLVRMYPTHCGAKRHTNLVVSEFLYSVACILDKPYEEVQEKYFDDLVVISPLFKQV